MQVLGQKSAALPAVAAKQSKLSCHPLAHTLSGCQLMSEHLYKQIVDLPDVAVQLRRGIQSRLWNSTRSRTLAPKRFTLACALQFSILVLSRWLNQLKKGDQNMQKRSTCNMTIVFTLADSSDGVIIILCRTPIALRGKRSLRRSSCHNVWTASQKASIGWITEHCVSLTHQGFCRLQHASGHKTLRF